MVVLRERRQWCARVLELGGELETGEGDYPYKQGKAAYLAQARRKGNQLRPALFTKFMGEQKSRDEPLQPKSFTVDPKSMKKGIKAAIRSMERNKAVGVDKVHAEILQCDPALFAHILTKLWTRVESGK